MALQTFLLHFYSDLILSPQAQNFGKLERGSLLYGFMMRDCPVSRTNPDGISSEIVGEVKGN
jgi:hypothetical protein